MKLMQLNAWGGRLEPQIGNIIRDEKPDIVCLQEAISYGGTFSGLFISIENIQKEHDLPYIAFEPVFSFSYMRSTAKFGNCILSRFPILESQAKFTHLEHVEDFHWQDQGANMRNFVHAVIEIPGGKRCNVITHHGYWIPDHKDGNDDTKTSVKVIADYVNKLEGPVIVTGDFNLAPNSESIRQLNAILTNLCVKHDVATTRTSLTRKTETCDYIFINGRVKEQGFTVSEEIASDHKALFLDFEV